MGNPVRVPLGELAYDFPLYARTCLKIIDKHGRRVPLELNFAQQKVEAAIAESLKRERPPRIIELKARQTGLSTDAEGRLFHRCHLRADRQGLVMAHTSESARLIFRMTKRYLNLLPASAKPKTAYSTKTEIEFSHNGSRLGVEVAKEGGGRGLTAQYVHLSEFAWYPKPEDTLTAISQAVPDTVDSLVIIESTAHGFNAFYDLWVQAESGQSDFTAIFIPWFDDPHYRMPSKINPDDLDEDEHLLIEQFGLTLEQLQWRRWAIRNKCKNDVNLFRQEYPATPKEAFLMSGRPVFDRSAIVFHQQFVPPKVPETTFPKKIDIEWDDVKKEPRLIDPFEGAPLLILQHPVPRHRYIVGTDPSEGDPGSDPSPHVVMDQMTLEPVALWWGRLRPDLLARKARALCVYYNRAFHIWEANNHGTAYGIAIEPLYDNIYMRETNADSVARKITDKPGYNTNVKSKAFLWDCLKRIVDDRIVQLRLPQLVKELEHVYFEDTPTQTIVKNYDGKPKDVLVGYGLCLEAHRGAYENDLVPLDVDDLEELVAEHRQAMVARSMGIEVDIAPVMERLHATADDLEELDEDAYSRRTRARMLGLVEAS